jgi:uncharacterized membrane protein
MIKLTTCLNLITAPLLTSKVAMKKLIFTYLIATVIFFGLDMLWLGVIAKNLYRQKLGFIMSGEVNWPAALIFYLLFIAGIIYFVINPAIQAGNWQLAFLNGALLGGLCYATYDLTNMATIAKWPLVITILDIAWGMILTATVSVATCFIAMKWIY